MTLLSLILLGALVSASLYTGLYPLAAVTLVCAGIVLNEAANPVC